MEKTQRVIETGGMDRYSLDGKVLVCVEICQADDMLAERNYTLKVHKSRIMVFQKKQGLQAINSESPVDYTLWFSQKQCLR